MKKIVISVLCMVAFLFNTSAQSYSIIIKGGLVIDPKNGVNEIMDIAIQDGKIEVR